MDYSEICYTKSCLSQVIIRLDFLEFIDNSILFNDSVEKVLLPNYPRKGMQQLIRFQTMNIIADPNGSKAEKTTRDGIQQEFVNSDGNKIVLSNKYIVLEINKYSKYEIEIDKFLPVLQVIMSEIQLTIMRTGIRYINEFGKNSINPQKSFFTSPSSAFADAKMMKNGTIQVIRSMALNEYIVEDMHLNFRYGQYNPEYPRPMKQMSFVLDYDCFCEEPIKGLDCVVEHINRGHDAIQELFESSITDKLRKEMSNG